VKELKFINSRPVALLSLVLGLSGLGLLFVALFADVIRPGRSVGFGYTQVFAVVIALDLIALGLMLSPWTRKVREAIGVPVVAGLAVILGAAGLLGMYAYTEKGARFSHDRTTGPPKVLRVISAAGLTGMGICRCSPTKTVSLDLGSDFKTLVQIYDAGGEGLRPGLVLIHGNVWQGQNLSTYRLLATLLARHGFIVLTYDQLGFGEADDMYGPGPEFADRAPLPLEQSDRAVQHLIENYPVDPAQLYVMGHSYGVDVALPTASLRPDVAGVVVYVAPPPPPDPTESSSARGEYFANRGAETYQFIYDRPLPDWQTWRANDEMLDPWKPYEMSGHKPVVVLLGENDQPEGHDAVRGQFARLEEPKSLVYLRGSDHYANTAQSLGFVFYDRKVAEQLRMDVFPALTSNGNP
jgi:pimeloyl-ACP methyl ester carboxylesterase